jgi:hypothetical protein
VNKDLYNKTIELPKEIVEYLETCFNHLPNSDSNTEGHNRNQELRNSGYVTYQQLGRIKNWFDNYDGDGTDAPYILNGADYMRDWVNNTLNGMRSIDSNKKQILLMCCYLLFSCICTYAGLCRPRLRGDASDMA